MSARFARVPIQAARMDLSKRAMRVLIAITGYANQAGSAYPSQERVAIDTGLNARTVRKAVRELIDAGLVSLEGKPQRTDAGTFRGTNTYRIHYGQPEAHRGPHTRGPQGASGHRPTEGLSPEGQGGPPNSPSLSAQEEQRESAPARSPSDSRNKGDAKTVIRSDWQLTDCMEAEAEACAVAKGVGQCIDWQLEADKFKARAHSKATRSANWEAEWSLWALHAIAFAQRNHGGTKAAACVARSVSRSPARAWSVPDDAPSEPTYTPPPDPEPEPDDPEEVKAAISAVQAIRDVRYESLALELVKERRRAGSPLHSIAEGARLAVRNDQGRDKLSACIDTARELELQRKSNALGDVADEPRAACR